jgi:hypothetical protein
MVDWSSNDEGGIKDCSVQRDSLTSTIFVVSNAYASLALY